MQILNFTRARVFVYGDVMLDRYWYGRAANISPEAPVPVLKIQDEEGRPGGAGNVAANIASLEAQVTLFAACGEDEAGETLEKSLTAAGVRSHLLHLADYNTITKLRVISVNQQLIRLDFEQNFPKETVALADDLIAALPQCGAVVLSDYDKGTLENIQQIIASARALNIPTFVDPKSLDFNLYRGASLITPNLKEFEAIVGRCHNQEELSAKGMVVIHEYDLDGLLVTQGKNGLTLLRREKQPLHISTQAQEVYDVTGAGDTVIATVATAVAAGFGLEDSVKMANTAAGIVVGKLGTSTVSLPELRHSLNGVTGSATAILDEEHLILIAAQAKKVGEKIVMTNGCFDILHPGHIAYLEQAKALGDRLIIAVNDDQSVREQDKPGKRPVNPLQQRMRVLAALEVVDWVVAFNEKTPARLIANVMPDVLVKGGDWQIEQIAGSKQVLANGGEVKVLNFIEGYSTTNMIEKIKEEV